MKKLLGNTGRCLERKNWVSYTLPFINIKVAFLPFPDSSVTIHFFLIWTNWAAITLGKIESRIKQFE